MYEKVYILDYLRKVFLGRPDHINIRNPIQRYGDYINSKDELVFQTTSKASRSGPPSTYLYKCRHRNTQMSMYTNKVCFLGDAHCYDRSSSARFLDSIQCISYIHLMYLYDSFGFLRYMYMRYVMLCIS